MKKLDQEQEESNEEDMGACDESGKFNAEFIKSLTAEERSHEATRRNRELNDKSTSKWCCTCLMLHPLTSYGKNSASIFGRRSDCQACMTYGGRRPRSQPQIGVRCEPFLLQLFAPAFSLLSSYLVTNHVLCRGQTQVQQEVEAAADVEVELEAAAEDTTRDEADNTGTTRSLAATERNRARRDHALQCKDDPKPSSKWCGRCLKDLSFSCYTKKKCLLFGRAAQCNACSTVEGLQLQPAVRYTHASLCHSITRYAPLNLESSHLNHTVTSFASRRRIPRARPEALDEKTKEETQDKKVERSSVNANAEITADTEDCTSIILTPAEEQFLARHRLEQQQQQHQDTSTASPLVQPSSPTPPNVPAPF
jgi:hypothetical protein